MQSAIEDELDGLADSDADDVQLAAAPSRHNAAHEAALDTLMDDDQIDAVPPIHNAAHEAALDMIMDESGSHHDGETCGMEIEVAIDALPLVVYRPRDILANMVPADIMVPPRVVEQPWVIQVGWLCRTSSDAQCGGKTNSAVMTLFSEHDLFCNRISLSQLLGA